MSLEAWGDGGDTGPDGYVTDVDAEQMVQDAVAERDDEIARLRADLHDAFREAKALAEALFKKHYSHEPHYASGKVKWEICDSAAGIITQIDNMVAGLERPI